MSVLFSFCRLVISSCMLVSGSSFSASSAWMSWSVLMPEERPTICSCPPAPVFVSVEVDVMPVLVIDCGVVMVEELPVLETPDVDIARLLVALS